MKATIVLGVLTAAASLTLTDAATAATNLNSSRSNTYRQGITVIDRRDARAVEACKAQGGSVEKQGEKTVCDIPASK